MKSSIKSFFLIASMFILSFILYQDTTVVQAAGTWFVAPGGNNGYACNNPLSPCATIQGAIDKAASGDMVKIAIGTYTAAGNQVALINKNITLSGGWDASFNSQNGRSTLDGQGARPEIWINSAVVSSLDHFILQNGKSGIVNQGYLTASYMIVQNNQGDDYCWGGGITNYGTMLIRWSSVSNNRCANGGYGGGIYSWQEGGPLTILNSTINNNQASTGGGIYNHNLLTIVNSTISKNTSTFGTSSSSGGGIYNDESTLVLRNVTISGNEGAQSGGGLYSSNDYRGSVTLENSIISGNTANASPDCAGVIGSSGYNIIGNTAGCTFNSTTGDQVNVNPKLGILQNNGGPTQTQWLYKGSPAIDSGNPIGCKDQLGNLLTADQRGFPRPLDGNQDGNLRCDSGAYEADPVNLPQPPLESLWYVTPAGNNNNNCHSPTFSCGTINGAIAKAVSGDTVYVSTGIYSTSVGSEVVFINKNISISGGWNGVFTQQNGLSTVDGDYKRRGITINREITVNLDRFIVQRGLSVGAGGGGVYIDYRSKLTLTKSIVQANIVGRNDPIKISLDNGGGIGMNNYGILTLADSWVLNNIAYGSGGGIFSSGSQLTLNKGVIGYNLARDGGGISCGVNGNIELNDSQVVGNVTTGPSGAGGGINSFNGTLYLNNSRVILNTAEGVGGGINGTTMTVNKGDISGNKGAGGGGIYNWNIANIRNSAITGNVSSSGNGGGIYSGGDLILVNTTIAANRAESTSGSAGNGGGVYRGGGAINASNVTIALNFAKNSGGGVANQPAPVTLQNTLLAENHAGTGPDCTGTIGSNGYNIVGNTSGCSFTPTTGDLANMDPRIARRYGLPAVFTLQPNSPAIDAGNPGGCKDQLGNPITADQIGTPRPKDGDGDHSAICDIGAFEYDPAQTLHWYFMPNATK